jgi:hypothetical protein
VRAPPDGYTLLPAVNANAYNVALYNNLNFNFIRDTAPVASIGHTLFVMVVYPSVPAMTVAEFIAYPKANPGKINFASAGIGGATHAAGELFKMTAGVRPGAADIISIVAADRWAHFGVHKLRSTGYLRNPARTRPLSGCWAAPPIALSRDGQCAQFFCLDQLD